jgi:hypothetical protein
MPYLLRFDGVNDEVTFPDVLAGASTFEINFDLTIKAAPLGYNSLLSNDNSSGGTARNHIFTRNNRAIEVACVIGGVRRAFETVAGVFTFNQRALLNLKYDGANLTLRVDGVQRGTIAATGVLNTTSGAGDRGFTRVGQNSSLGFPNIDLYSLEFIENGTTVRNYSPDASQPGSSLVNTLGGNNGALVNFTVPACWVFYSSGATYQLTALGGTFSYAGAQASLLRRFRLQTLGATYAYSGASANLTYVPTGTVYTLTALGGSFSYSGGSANVRANRKLVAQGGNYSYSGGQASLLRRFRLVANGVAYAYSGGSANLTYNQLPGIYRLTALGATYTYTGGIATLTATGVTPMANAGAYVIQAYVGGTQTINAKIGGRQTIQAMVAI